MCCLCVVAAVMDMFSKLVVTFWVESVASPNLINDSLDCGKIPRGRCAYKICKHTSLWGFSHSPKNHLCCPDKSRQLLIEDCLEMLGNLSSGWVKSSNLIITNKYVTRHAKTRVMFWNYHFGLLSHLKDQVFLNWMHFFWEETVYSTFFDMIVQWVNEKITLWAKSHSETQESTVQSLCIQRNSVFPTSQRTGDVNGQSLFVYAQNSKRLRKKKVDLVVFWTNSSTQHVNPGIITAGQVCDDTTPIAIVNHRRYSMPHALWRVLGLPQCYHHCDRRDGKWDWNLSEVWCLYCANTITTTCLVNLISVNSQC